jgi:hypothetical protein
MQILLRNGLFFVPKFEQFKSKAITLLSLLTDFKCLLMTC